MNDYYDVNLKEARLKQLTEFPNFYNYKGFVQDEIILEKIYLDHNPNIIIHLAAQAGVRYSINNPAFYVESNLIGTFKILEIAKKYKINHLLIASTSSVYGSNEKMPLAENYKTSHPLSFYAATKKSNEVMAHSYSHLFNIPTTLMRFFTVYGPWGRPDMALFKFTKNILLDNPINVFNKGNMERDFTYISDIVNAIFLLISKVPTTNKKGKNFVKNDSISKDAPYRIVNIGNSQPINLLDCISELEKVLGKNAKKIFLEMQDGDLVNTHSSNDLLNNLTGFVPKINVSEGIPRFVKWFKEYYN